MQFNSNGLSRDTYEEILNDLKTKTAEIFGSDVATDSSSFMGMHLRLMSNAIDELQQEIEQVYFGQFLNYANGIQLDRLGANFGVTRNPATFATVELTFTGQPGFVIDEQTNFSTDTGIVFTTLDECTLDTNGNGSVIAGSDMLDPIANINANQIWTANEPNLGLKTIENLTQATGASFVETDFAYRSRIYLAQKGQVSSTVNGILTALYSVAGVQQAIVSENAEMTTDANGNPPKSIHAIVKGGGIDDIANALFNVKPAGIKTFGAQTKQVIDLAGKSHDVSFDYAQSVPVYMTITVSTNEKYANDGDAQIQQSIASGFESLNMGDTLFYSKIFGYVYSVTGVTNVQATVGTTSEPTGAIDITAEINQFLDVQSANIKVVHL